MFKKILLYIIIIYSLGNYFQFFSWYLGGSQMIIEDAFSLSLHSSLPMFLAIFLIHIFYYPKTNKDHASVISFPPIIFLFFTNSGFFISTLNLYFLRLYNVPEFLNVLRSYEIGLLLIISALIIFIISINTFNKVDENPIPTSSTTQIISKSIYKYTRNPMYLAMLILQIGIGMSLSMVHIIFFVIFTYVVLKYYVILPEEKYLEKKFGTQYLVYKKTVRRWL